MEYDWNIALEHELIREFVGYEVISQIDSFDMPIVINFLEIVQNYMKMCESLNKNNISRG